MPTTLHTATVLCSMAAPPQSGAGLLVDGERILAVGDAGRLRPDAVREVHHDGVLLPGFVDARTCVEHADLARAGAATRPEEWDAGRWGRSARRGVHALLRAGVATNGDVVHRGAGVPACARAGLTGDSWLRIADVDRGEHDAVLAATSRSLGLPARGRRVGLNPRPLALGTGVLQALAVLTNSLQAPVHLTFEGSLAEREALTGGRGPLADQARATGLAFEWLDEGTALEPLGYLDALGLLTPRSSVAPVLEVSPGEATLLARRGVTVVFGGSPSTGCAADVPLERFAEAGTAMALGSGEAGDVLAGAASWVATAGRRGLARWPGPTGPLSLAEVAVRLATVDGARSMGWGAHAGLLAAGRRADFVVVDLETTPEHAYEDVARQGAGRQILTVLAGVRRARRTSADDPWPPIESDEQEPPPGGADPHEEGGR